MAIDIGRIPVNGAVICEVEHYTMSPTSSLDCWLALNTKKNTDMNICIYTNAHYTHAYDHIHSFYILYTQTRYHYIPYVILE